MAILPKLVIIGAGGFGREILAWAEQSVQFDVDWTIKGFIDDNVAAFETRPARAPLLGTVRDHEPRPDEVFICAIGTPRIKQACSELIAARGGRFTQLFHRSAVLGHEVEMQAGVILCPYSVISGYNRLGLGVAVNLHSSVDHDAEVGDWSQINCHCDLTGNVRLGRRVFLGSHVAVLPGVAIGDDSVLGAGSVVLRDVKPGSKVVGVPGRNIA